MMLWSVEKKEEKLNDAQSILLGDDRAQLRFRKMQLSQAFLRFMTRRSISRKMLARCANILNKKGSANSANCALVWGICSSLVCARSHRNITHRLIILPGCSTAQCRVAQALGSAAASHTKGQSLTHLTKQALPHDGGIYFTQQRRCSIPPSRSGLQPRPPPHPIPRTRLHHHLRHHPLLSLLSHLPHFLTHFL